jgi:hypothetical protein
VFRLLLLLKDVIKLPIYFEFFELVERTYFLEFSIKS